jgi:hypothetical protein
MSALISDLRLQVWIARNFPATKQRNCAGTDVTMKKNTFLAAMLVLVSGVPTSRAAVISFAVDFDQQSGGGIDSTGGEFVDNFGDLDFIALPRFDALLGTLQNVSLVLNSSFGLQLSGRALDLDAESFIPFLLRHNDTNLAARATASMLVRLFDPDGSNVVMNRTVADSCQDSISQIIGGPDNGFAGCALALGSPFGYLSDAGAFNWEFPAHSFGLADFQGADPINLYAQSIGSVFGFCDDDDVGDHCQGSARLNWSGAITVTYDYLAREIEDGGGNGTSVPEPSTLALLGSALLGVALRRRRCRVDMF